MARLMVAVLAAAQGVAGCGIDWNKTHATNPLWPGHARFHLVWQSLSTLFLAAVAVALVSRTGPALQLRFCVAAILTAIPLLAFTLALLTRGLYAGTLHDPNGIPPLRLRLFGQIRELDGNAIAVGAGWIVLLIAIALFRQGS